LYLPALRKVKNCSYIHIWIRINKKLITSRGSPVAHAYHVWSTSVTAFMSYPLTDRMNDRTNNHVTPPALAE